MVINHIEKQFVTSDAGTIMRELDVEHPAAKLMVLASQMQEAEMGDGTNFVIVFCGALLEAAEELLRLGVTVSDICEGYERALDKALEILPTLVCHEVKNFRDVAKVTECLRTAVMSKQLGNEDFLAALIAKACTSVLPEKSTFNVDNIRVCKILGSGLQRSQVVNGMVFKRETEGDVTNVKQAKIALYSCAVDIIQTETKGTVLIKTAEELKNFSTGEENLLDAQIKAIADTGAKVIVAGAKFGDMALHYMNKYGLMAVRLNSKFDLRRLSKAVSGTVLPRLTPPTAEEMGYCDSVFVDEFADTTVTIFRNDSAESRIATILIRGATDNYMDDIERAIDDGVNTFKGLTRDGKFLPGAGAVEIELSQQLADYANTLPGLDQYSVRNFARSLEVFPKALADNTGVNATELISKLHSAHQSGSKNEGFDVDAELPATIDAVAAKIFDLYDTKYWALKYATSTACTILRVDQIIMAKRAGGPKPRAPQGSDDES